MTIRFNHTTLLVLAIFGLTIIPNFMPNQNKQSEFEFDRTRNEGYVAFLVNENTNTKPDTDETINECDCNGTKELTHGDGHKTPCPCTSSSEGCKCKKIENETPETTESNCQCGNGCDCQGDCTCNVVDSDCDCGDGCDCIGECECDKEEVPVLKAPRIQIAMFTATWCAPCQQFKQQEVPKFSSKWRVGTSIDSHIKLIDVDKSPKLYDKYRQMFGNGVPLFVKAVDGKIVGHKKGFQTASTISLWYNDNE